MEFLPEPLSEAALAALVDEAVAATGAATPRDTGKVLQWLSPKTQGKVDGKQLGSLVNRRLAGGR